MPSPFPGMDPYLEHPDIWPEVHHWLITLIAETLVPQVRPNYRVAIEKRIYDIVQPAPDHRGNVLVGIPDVSIHRQLSQQEPISSHAATITQPQTVTVPMPEQIKQSYLEIRDLQTGQVVTAIEILSPVNKRSGEGREIYLRKRQRILNSLTHLVEIDLLRNWEPMPVLGSHQNGDYHILVSHSKRRPSADWYAIDITEVLPTLPVPLLNDDEVASIDMQTLFSTMYDRAGFDYVLDYTCSLNPELPNAKANWVKQVLLEGPF